MLARLDCHQEYVAQHRNPTTSLSGTDGPNFRKIWLLKKSFFVQVQVRWMHRDFWDSFWGIFFRAILGETETAEKRPSNPEPTAIDGFWGEAAVFEAHGRTSLWENRDVGAGASFFQVNLPGLLGWRRFGVQKLHPYLWGGTHLKQLLYIYFPGFLHANYPHFVVLVGW